MSEVAVCTPRQRMLAAYEGLFSDGEPCDHGQGKEFGYPSLHFYRLGLS